MPNKAEVLSGLTHEGVSKDQFPQANWYYLLFLAAEKLDSAEIPIVESWLNDIKPELAKVAADTKTDRRREIKKKVPPKHVNETIRYVLQERLKINKGKRPKADLKALIAEHLRKNIKSKEVAAMAKQLQPSRYGWMLDTGQPADTADN